MILSQNQIVLRVPTAGGGWCLCRKTKMTLGSILYRTDCFPPPWHILNENKNSKECSNETLQNFGELVYIQD